MAKKIISFKKKTVIVELKEILESSIKDVLINILRKEDKFVDLKILDEITQTSRGYLRAAINDLQTISNLEKKDEIIFYERNKEEDIFTILKYIFQEPTKLEALGSFDKLDMSIYEIIL